MTNGVLHTDRLGSITNASDDSGASIATQRYTANGSRWALKSSGTLPTDRGFTGQIRDGSLCHQEYQTFDTGHAQSSTSLVARCPCLSKIANCNLGIF
ncbi:MAG TPA: hypothetical protein VFZ25_08315 [Chloroflexota bacterium]|nr:hypothetical protein [Chloroflexota bacterium]